MMLETRRLKKGAALEVRSADDQSPTKLRGYAALFDEPSPDLEGFVEVVERGAFDLAADTDVLGRYNHELLLGSQRGKTLTLEVDERGLLYELTPPDTEHGRHVLEMVRRGDVTGSSFMFSTIDAEYGRRDGALVRTLQKVRLYDVGPVDLPYYPQTGEGENAVKARGLASIPTAGFDIRNADLRRADAIVTARAAGLELEDDEIEHLRRCAACLTAALPKGGTLADARARLEAAGI